jgi:hypothetical protein
MQLLIKMTTTRLAAHMVDAQGHQLCKVAIKRSDWQIHDRAPDGLIICAHCKHKYQLYQLKEA